ncbi:MAG: cell wall-binding repeat-containing protein [Clostridia bacterium]|nr:cell wall-binding repeat-containing protein [Clostridia bacterium]
MRYFNVKLTTIILCLILSISIIMPHNTYALSTPKPTDFTGLTAATTGTALPTQSERIFGEDRYATAAAVAKAGWNTSYYAIIASGENFPDALCAAPLAAKYNAPILLTSANSLDEQTKDQLLNLKVKSVIMVGGEGVLTAEVEKVLKDLGINVSRVAGQDRYETSLQVARILGPVEEAVIATGKDFPDVLSIAPIAALKGMPILLTPKDELSVSLRDYINKKVTRTYVLGDPGVVSDTVVNQLPSPQRLSGSNRYESNTGIIKEFVRDLDLSTSYLATGEDFPDALSGSVLASLTKSPLVLVKTPLEQATLSLIQNNAALVKKVIALGGTGVVSDDILTGLASGTGAGADNQVLSSPAQVTAASQSPNQIFLRWDSVPDAGFYHISRSAAYNGPYVNIAIVNATEYTDSNLSSGIRYYYKVQSANSCGVSVSSAMASAIALTPTDSAPLTAPTNVAAMCRSNNYIDLTWNAVSSAVSYNIYRTTSDSGIYTLIDAVNTPYYTDSSTVSGKMYFYKIQAAKATATGPYSTVVTVATALDSSILAAPANVVATLRDSNQIYLSWNPVSKAEYYIVYRSTSYDGSYARVALSSSIYYLDSGLRSSQTYYYKVQAVNNIGSSAYSNVAYGMTAGQ